MLYIAVAAALLASPSFDPAIPTPKSTLGFEPGQRPATPAQIVEYFEALAASTPRARLKVMGHTYEGRPLVVLTVSSEANISRSEQVADQFRRASDPRVTASDRAAERAVKDLPAVAWMGYSIHGNEVSGADASMVVAYRLAAGTDKQTQMWRQNVITYIDPLQNPDGRQRAVATFESNQSKVPDLDVVSLPNAEMWPYGRGNHYLFDLNRDWFTLIQQESRARVPIIARLLPQLQVDAHEMGSDSSYLFSPPRMPFNPHRPSTHHAWEQRFARDQAHAFDENGWSYYTREWNEEFYAGYGSSWIIYLGAIGILYEQAGSMGQTVRQEAGTLLTYPDAVAHQATSSFANLDTLARHRAGILKDWLNGRRQAARPSLRAPKAYIIRADRYPDRANAFVNTLQMLNIDVLRAEGTMRMNDLTDFYGRKQNVSLPPGTIAVPLDQPNARLIRNILDFHLPMEAAFLREQRAYLEKEKGSRLYETTAWALPHAYALTTYWTTKKLSGRWKPASANTQSAAATETQPPKAPKYGFLINGQTDAAVQLAGRLLAQGLALRVAREPTSIQGRRFERGSILVKNEGNPKDLPARLAAASAKLGIEVFGVDTGLATRGTDLGGDNFTPIIAPRVAIIAGDPIRPDAFGFVWHLLDERAGLRLSRLNMARLMSTDLARYNVIVVPHSFSAGALRARLGKATFEKLKAWVDAGGTLIGLGNGAEAISHPDSTMTKSRFRRHVLDQYPPVVFGLDPTVADEAGRLRAVGLRATQKVDPKNPKPSTGWSDERRPYHVPPVIGPGARAFMTSSPAPFAWPAKRTTLDAWTKTLGPKDDKAKKAFLSRADARLRRFLPSGAYLSAQTDDDHWLNYGVERRLPVHFSARDALIAEAPAETAVRFENVETLHLGGLLWPEAAGRLAKTAYLVRETQGRGQVILFASDPAFRGSAFGTQRLLLNAIIWGPGLGTAWVRPW